MQDTTQGTETRGRRKLLPLAAAGAAVIAGAALLARRSMNGSRPDGEGTHEAGRVFLSPGGQRYHRAGCRAGGAHLEESTLDAAMAQGRTPCALCQA
jgi:hypothetical protein